MAKNEMRFFNITTTFELVLIISTSSNVWMKEYC